MDEPDDGQAGATTVYPIGSPPSKPFALSEVLTDPRLAEAALEELHTGRVLGKSSSSKHGSMKQRQVEELVPPEVPDDHLSKIMEAAEVLDEGVQEESQVNNELAEIIIKQLESSRSELESLCHALTALITAEQVYCSSLSRAVNSKPRPTAKPPATSNGSDAPSATNGSDASSSPLAQRDSSRGRQLEALCKLPMLLLPIHQQLTGGLAPVQHQLQHLTAEYQRACKEVSGQAQAVQKAVDTARMGLHAACAQHREASTSLRSTLQQRGSGRAAVSPGVDPWALERRLVQELRALQRCQDKERSFLRTAFSHARELEMNRNECVSQVFSSMSDSYLAALQGMQAHVQHATSGHPARGVVGQPGCDQPESQAEEQGEAEGGGGSGSSLLEELTRAADTASEATAALAARMADSIQAVNTEVFCSPEIVRQGELQSWNNKDGKWMEGHAVLTRAGFLYWFRALEDGSPGSLAGELNLTKLQFEAGQAPCFNLVAEPAGLDWPSLLGLPRARPKLSFQASSIEECCEWAIAIREAIAVACGKQVA